MRILHLCLIASLSACLDPASEPDPTAVVPIGGVELPTLVVQRRHLEPIALVEVPRGTRRSARVDKYTLELGGIAVHGAGMRVQVDAHGNETVVDPLRVGALARDAVRVPAVTAADAQQRAVEARRASLPGSVPRAAGAELAFQAMLAIDDDPRYRRLDELRLTWRIGVIDRADHTVPTVIAVVDAETGDVIREEPAFSTGTAQGFGAFGAYTLQVESTLPFGQPAPDGSVCLADVTRGVNISNGNPCGPLGLGIHTFIDLPPDASHFAETRRVTDTDGVFGDSIFIQTLGREEAESERGRTNAADAHRSVGRAYDFFRLLGREVLGVNQSLQIRVNSLQNPGNASFTFASGLILIGTHLSTTVPPADPNNRGAIAPATNVEYLTHEYNHGVLYAEIGSPQAKSQFGAIHEGVGDVFGVLADAWNGGATLTAPVTWAWADDIYGATRARVFDQPSRQVAGWDAVTPGKLFELAAETTSVHAAGGVVRRMFYFLANGAVATTPPTTALNTSTYLPEGMTGIGVDPAARVLWRAISDHISPGAHPSFLDFRNAMVAAAGGVDFGGSCSVTQKATMDAWAAVNVGAKADRVGPGVNYSFSKVGAAIRVVVRVFPQPSETPRATVRVDSLTQPIVLDHITGFGAPLLCGQSECYYGTIDMPVTGQGNHDLEITANDGCGNDTVKAQKFDLDAPSGLTVLDRNYYRSSVRVFRLTAQDSSSTLFYGLSVGTLVKQGTLSSGVATDVNFDLTTLPGGTTTLQFWVRDESGNETSYQQPYYVDRTKPSSCAVDADDLTGGGGIRIRGSGCETETSLEILDVWINGAPWWWVDRKATGDRALTMSSSQCGYFQRDYAAPFGTYELEVRCADDWGNTKVQPKTYNYTNPPTLSTSVSTNATAGTFTISTTARSGRSDLQEVQYWRPGGPTLETDLCTGTSTTCLSSFSSSQPAGSTQTYQVRAWDQESRYTDELVTVVMPMPPPPPPPPTVFNEVEQNDRPQTANRPPRSTRTINGTVRFDDSDGVCARTSAEVWASCNVFVDPWNCKFLCGDYFGFELNPGQALTYRANQIDGCFRFNWGWQPNVGETATVFTGTSVPEGTRVTNISSTRRWVMLGAYVSPQPGIQCSSSYTRTYSFDVTVPPL